MTPVDKAPTRVLDLWVNKACQPGKGPLTCKYLMFGEAGYMCAKGSTFQAFIDTRSLKAQGDNCSGPPDFQPLEGD